MISIKHNDLRLSKNVIKVTSTQVAMYQRVRGELFKQQFALDYCEQEFFTVFGKAISEFNTASSLDIVLDGSMCTPRTMEKRFGVGWTISEDSTSVEICISGLFDESVIKLLIKKDIIKNILDSFHNLQVEFGRLLYATPNKDFRYAVYSQLSNIRNVSDVVNSVLVNYCVSLPRFCDSVDYDRNLQLRTTENNTIGAAHSSLSVPYDPQQVEIRSLVENVVGPKGSNELFEHKTNFRDLNHLEVSDELSDPTICILLDESLNTAIAASAYLAEIASHDAIVVEIGLWRKKLKSAFQRFTCVFDVFEFLNLPLTTHNLKDVRIFLQSSDRRHLGYPLVVVMGEEMLDDVITSQMVLAVDILPRYNLIVLGQRNTLLEKKWKNILQFAQNARWCDVKIADCNNDAGYSKVPFENISVQSFSLSPMIKQQLAIAEKTNTLRAKLSELSLNIFQHRPSFSKSSKSDSVDITPEKARLLGGN